MRLKENRKEKKERKKAEEFIKNKYTRITELPKDIFPENENEGYENKRIFTRKIEGTDKLSKVLCSFDHNIVCSPDCAAAGLGAHSSGKKNMYCFKEQFFI